MWLFLLNWCFISVHVAKMLHVCMWSVQQSHIKGLVLNWLFFNVIPVAVFSFSFWLCFTQGCNSKFELCFHLTKVIEIYLSHTNWKLLKNLNMTSQTSCLECVYMFAYNLGFIPVESLHLMSTAQHVASFFSKLLQGPPAIVQLLYIKQSTWISLHILQSLFSPLFYFFVNLD